MRALKLNAHSSERIQARDLSGMAESLKIDAGNAVRWPTATRTGHNTCFGTLTIAVLGPLWISRIRGRSGIPLRPARLSRANCGLPTLLGSQPTCANSSAAPSSFLAGEDFH